MAILPQNGTRPQTDVRAVDNQAALAEVVAKLADLERAMAEASKPRPLPDTAWLMTLAYVLTMAGIAISGVVWAFGQAFGGAQ